MRFVGLWAVALSLLALSCGQSQQVIASSDSARETISTAPEITSNTVDTARENIPVVDKAANQACDAYALLLLDKAADDLPNTGASWLSEMRMLLEQFDPIAANVWDGLLEIELAPESVSLEDWVPLAANLDKITFESCGLPLLSAHQQVSASAFECTTSGLDDTEDCGAFRATSWPCFALAEPSSNPYANKPELSGLDYYQAIDCDSGTPVQIDFGSEWVVFDPLNDPANSKFAVVED